MKTYPGVGLAASAILMLVAQPRGARALPLCLDHHLEIRHEPNLALAEYDHFEFELVAKSGLAEYSLTLETLGARREHRARVQIIRHRARNERIEHRLREFVTRLPGTRVEEPDGPAYRAALDFGDEIDLRVHLAWGLEWLGRAEPGFALDASPLRETPDRYGRRGVTRVLEDFMQRHLRPAPAFTRAAFLDVRNAFLRELTPREQTYFDWAIFSEKLGYRVSAKLDLVGARWRTLDPEGSRPVDEVHAGMREKLLVIARRGPAPAPKSLRRKTRSETSLAFRNKSASTTSGED